MTVTLRTLLAAALAWCAVTSYARGAAAQRVRRRFEPTDLSMREQGTAEIDLQAGVVRGSDSSRIVAPDVEASLGLSRSAQLQVETTFGFDELSLHQAQFFENTWVAAKVGVVDAQDEDSRGSWVAGAQAGPRLPTALGSRGLGAEAIAIAGRASGRLHLFVQAGALLDSELVDGPRIVRPFAIEGGVDLDLDLDDEGVWSVKGELGGAKFVSGGGDQLQVTASVAEKPVKWLELSITGVAGAGSGDRLGVLFGAATQFRVF